MREERMILKTSDRWNEGNQECGTAETWRRRRGQIK